MNKVEALENIKNVWNDKNIILGEKIEKISSYFYSTGLDLLSTASFIKATPSELDALLSLSELDEDLINRISLINPPKTTWIMLANASHEEIEEALKVMEKNLHPKILYSELVYKSMIDIAGSTPEQKVNKLKAGEIKRIREKAEQYKMLSAREINFLKSIASQKGRKATLSEKQISWFLSILNKLVDANVFSKNSMDDDQELCDKVLECLGR